MAVNVFSTILGGIALVVGAISVLWPVLGIKAHYQVDVFALIVLAIGLYLLIPGSKKKTNG
jgi:membrane-associated phospholipid phosphatase